MHKKAHGAYPPWADSAVPGRIRLPEGGRIARGRALGAPSRKRARGHDRSSGSELDDFDDGAGVRMGEFADDKIVLCIAEEGLHDVLKRGWIFEGLAGVEFEGESALGDPCLGDVVDSGDAFESFANGDEGVGIGDGVQDDDGVVGESWDGTGLLGARHGGSGDGEVEGDAGSDLVLGVVLGLCDGLQRSSVFGLRHAACVVKEAEICVCLAGGFLGLCGACPRDAAVEHGAGAK